MQTADSNCSYRGKGNLFNSMLPELLAAGTGCAEVKIAQQYCTKITEQSMHSLRHY